MGEGSPCFEVLGWEEVGGTPPGPALAKQSLQPSSTLCVLGQSGCAQRRVTGKGQIATGILFAGRIWVKWEGLALYSHLCLGVQWGLLRGERGHTCHSFGCTRPTALSFSRSLKLLLLSLFLLSKRRRKVAIPPPSLN